MRLDVQLSGSHHDGSSAEVPQLQSREVVNLDTRAVNKYEMIGSTLGNYKILEKLGEGGQGTVYRAVDSKLGRTVVIKVLPAQLTAKEANLKRFEREARLASALDHPNICTIFDLNEINGIHFIAMQYIEGRNVRQLVNGRPLSLESALSITLQVADALASAHAR